MGADPGADCLQHARTTEQHERLKPFAGTWRAEIKFWMGPGEPMVSTGTMTNTLIHNGLFLRQEYKGDPNDGPFPAFEGTGLWGYNTLDGRWEGVWIDNAISMIQMETGQVDDSGKVWTMHSTMTDPGSGTPTKKRSVITLLGKDKHTMEMFFQPEGSGQEGKGMEITYTRA